MLKTKKTLTIKSEQDVSMFTDEYIETIIAQAKQTAILCGTNLEVKVVKEEIEEETTVSPISLVDRMLQSVFGERKENDERPRD